MDPRNQLPLLIPPADREAIAAQLVIVPLASGEILYEPDYPVDWVYFPITAVLSVVTVMVDGRTVECDTVGYESAVGVLAGAVRVSAARLRRQSNQSSGLRQLLIRHTYAHQSAACNALHALEQRLCKWLLMSQDRAADTKVRLTKQYLATMLGVQRTTVTAALRDLADKQLIRRGRGYVEILDRAWLEALVCECYEAVQENLQRVVDHLPERAAAGPAA